MTSYAICCSLAESVLVNEVRATSTSVPVALLDPLISLDANSHVPELRLSSSLLLALPPLLLEERLLACTFALALAFLTLELL
jgi:hypothetical protein